MSEPGGELEGQRLLREESGGVVVPRDVFRAHGADTTTFLQGQLSQEIALLPVGASAWTFALQPQGKVDAWFRITKVGDEEEEYVLDVDGGHGEALLARLERFKLRVDCTIEPLPWTVVALRGPALGERGSYGAPVEAEAGWSGVPGFDLLGPDVAVPDGVPEVSLGALDAVRIEAGVPRMGWELTEATIPEEAGIVAQSVSFTKGCFTGQELVARIDSRGGNVPRRLRGLIVGSPGTELEFAL